jgi:hypothetical protein
MLSLSLCWPEKVIDYLSDFVSQQRRYGVSDLLVLLCPWPLEEVVIREGLNPRRLSHCQRPTL